MHEKIETNFIFRGWDEISKTMYYPVSLFAYREINNKYKHHIFIEESLVIKAFNHRCFVPYHYKATQNGYFLLDCFKIMIYTGVNDSENNKIYVSDIVEQHYNDNIFTAEVIFKDGSFKLLADNEILPFVLIPPYPPNYYNKIIGNIYDQNSLKI